MQNWSLGVDQCFEWWRAATVNYLSMLKQDPFLRWGVGLFGDDAATLKEWLDRTIGQTWSRFRLFPAHEVSHLREQMNSVTAAVASLQELMEQERANKGRVEDCRLMMENVLHSSATNFHDLAERLAGVDRLEPIEQSLERLRENVASLSQALDEVRAMLAELDPKISGLPALLEQSAKRAARRTDSPAKQN